ncbi:hypothetical protein [Senegalimassilia faecalis]|uniref:hypothetical protein n=1 Tax=Senegalimassilia faecalis TaxID=2509433 RepID=UPI003077C398
MRDCLGHGEAAAPADAAGFLPLPQWSVVDPGGHGSPPVAARCCRNGRLLIVAAAAGRCSL